MRVCFLRTFLWAVVPRFNLGIPFPQTIFKGNVPRSKGIVRVSQRFLVPIFGTIIELM